MFVATGPTKVLPLLVLISIALLQAHANPVPQQLKNIQNANAEIQDLNEVPTTGRTNTAAEATDKTKTMSLEENDDEKNAKPFSHRDEDDMVANALDDRYKYDVEILENSDRVQEGKDDLEERFRGSALKFNSGTVFPEDIEVTIVPSPSDQHHRVVGYALLIFGLVALIFYVACVVWRRYLDERYGSRELLDTTNDDDDDFLRQAHSSPPASQ